MREVGSQMAWPISLLCTLTAYDQPWGEALGGGDAWLTLLVGQVQP